MNVPRSEAGAYALAPFLGRLGLGFCTVVCGTVASIYIFSGQPGSAVAAAIFCVGSGVGTVVLMRRQP